MGTQSLWQILDFCVCQLSDTVSLNLISAEAVDLKCIQAVIYFMTLVFCVRSQMYCSCINYILIIIIKKTYSNVSCVKKENSPLLWQIAKSINLYIEHRANTKHFVNDLSTAYVFFLEILVLCIAVMF